MRISIDRRRWATIAITLGLAFASGYVMQNFLVVRGPESSSDDIPASSAIQVPSPESSIPSLSTPPILAGRTRETRFPSEKVVCRPRLFVNPAPAATIRVDLYAPCQPGVPVTLTQDGVAVLLATDQNGRLHLRMPALSTAPRIKLDLDGHPMMAALEMPEAAGYRHVALLWSGQQALRINAYEFGAGKSELGHVWTGSPKSPSRALRGAGGFLMQLGDGDGAMAEIYSFPVDRPGTSGVVRLDVEAEVTDANCGREIEAEALQPGVSDSFVRTKIAMVMPDCGRTGEILRLQNLLRDMRLAER